jgi:hypothetical protein
MILTLLPALSNLNMFGPRCAMQCKQLVSITKILSLGGEIFSQQQPFARWRDSGARHNKTWG